MSRRFWTKSLLSCLNLLIISVRRYSVSEVLLQHLAPPWLFVAFADLTEVEIVVGGLLGITMVFVFTGWYVQST